MNEAIERLIRWKDQCETRAFTIGVEAAGGWFLNLEYESKYSGRQCDMKKGCSLPSIINLALDEWEGI